MKNIGRLIAALIVSAILIISAECEAHQNQTEFRNFVKEYQTDISGDIIFFDEIPEPLCESFRIYTKEEMDLLMAIAMAEAEGEDAKGKALIMRVVLNRCEHDGKTIKEVIYEPNQFAIDRMWITPSENCYEAFAMICDGWDESEGARWFCAGGYSKYGDRLWQYGGHYFSR